MICYFWEGLKISIKVEIEQQDQVSTSFKEMVQKTINVEAKAGLRFSAMVQNSDAYCPKSHCPSHNTSLKIQTQGSKNFFRLKKPKFKDPKSALLRNNVAKLPKKDNRKDKKKRFWGQRREHT